MPTTSKAKSDGYYPLDRPQYLCDLQITFLFYGFLPFFALLRQGGFATMEFDAIALMEC